MTRPFKISTLFDFAALIGCTFFAELQDGTSRYSTPGGLSADPCGPQVVPVSPSVSPVNKKVSMTTGIYGLLSYLLSPSAILQQSLESRLRVLLNGSTSCEVTWKPWITPWGVCLSKPRARERTIFGIDIGLWPTPRANEATGDKRHPNRQGGAALKTIVKEFSIAMWPTATASDVKSRSASQATLERNARPLREIQFAVWSTIRASDGEKGGPNMSFGAGGSPLPSQVSTIANTSNAPTENGAGSLHPEFAGWEMGYPPEWLH